MSGLINEKCTACRRDSPRVTETEIQELKPQIPEWTLVEREGVQRLERVFRFTNFADALNFTNRVGALAEEEGHHPAILTEWGRVTVTLWTHKIRGLRERGGPIACATDWRRTKKTQSESKTGIPNECVGEAERLPARPRVWRCGARL
jgi:4a-hydroxytetrahydrobiopterin dehydratase